MNEKIDALLHLAVSKGDKKFAESLLAAGAAVNAGNIDGGTSLHIAVMRADTELAAWLLANGADVNTSNIDSDKPLHFAVEKGYKEIAAWLLANGAEVNARNRYYRTPLHIAVQINDKEFTQFLLVNGAEVNAEDKYGFTPLHIVAERGYKEIAVLLISNGANMRALSKFNETPLCISILTDSKAFTLFLISVMISHNPDEKKPNSIQDKTEFSDYWDQTVAKYNELLSLKKTILAGKSLFDFYNANDINTLASMSRNENRNKEIQAKITSEQFIEDHPLCVEKLQKNFKEGVERVELLNRLLSVFCSAEFPCSLPPELWESTLAYLPNSILQGFFKANSPSGADKQNLVMDKQRQHRLN